MKNFKVFEIQLKKICNNRSFLPAQMSLDAYLGIFSVIPDCSPLSSAIASEGLVHVL